MKNKRLLFVFWFWMLLMLVVACGGPAPSLPQDGEEVEVETIKEVEVETIEEVEVETIEEVEVETIEEVMTGIVLTSTSVLEELRLPPLSTEIVTYTLAITDVSLVGEFPEEVLDTYLQGIQPISEGTVPATLDSIDLFFEQASNFSRCQALVSTGRIESLEYNFEVISSDIAANPEAFLEGRHLTPGFVDFLDDSNSACHCAEGAEVCACNGGVLGGCPMGNPDGGGSGPRAIVSGHRVACFAPQEWLSISQPIERRATSNNRATIMVPNVNSITGNLEVISNPNNVTVDLQEPDKLQIDIVTGCNLLLFNVTNSDDDIEGYRVVFYTYP